MMLNSYDIFKLSTGEVFFCCLFLAVLLNRVTAIFIRKEGLVKEL